MPEYGIQLDGAVIVGPHWGSPADVIESFHAFGTNRVYGQLVVRALDPRPESRRDPVTGDIDAPGAPLPEWSVV